MFDRVIIDYGHGGMIDEKYQTPGGKQYHFTEPEVLSIFEGCDRDWETLLFLLK